MCEEEEGELSPKQLVTVDLALCGRLQTAGAPLDQVIFPTVTVAMSFQNQSLGGGGGGTSGAQGSTSLTLTSQSTPRRLPIRELLTLLGDHQAGRPVPDWVPDERVNFYETLEQWRRSKTRQVLLALDGLAQSALGSWLALGATVVAYRRARREIEEHSDILNAGFLDWGQTLIAQWHDQLVAASQQDEAQAIAHRTADSWFCHTRVQPLNPDSPWQRDIARALAASEETEQSLVAMSSRWRRRATQRLAHHIEAQLVRDRAAATGRSLWCVINSDRSIVFTLFPEQAEAYSLLICAGIDPGWATGSIIVLPETVAVSCEQGYVVSILDRFEAGDSPEMAEAAEALCRSGMDGPDAVRAARLLAV